MRVRSFALVAAFGASACFGGGLGEIGPGTANSYRTGSGVVPAYQGASYGYEEHHAYTDGDVNMGVLLGWRAGYVSGTSDATSGTGLATDFHFDVAVNTQRFGVAATGGYTSDFLLQEGGASTLFHAFPVGGYAMLLVLPRVYLHAGGAYLVAPGLKQQDKNGNDVGSDTPSLAYRGVGGISFLLNHQSNSDFILRIEARHTRTSSMQFGNVDATYHSTAIGLEAIWVSF